MYFVPVKVKCFEKVAGTERKDIFKTIKSRSIFMQLIYAQQKRFPRLFFPRIRSLYVFDCLGKSNLTAISFSSKPFKFLTMCYRKSKAE